MGLAIETFSNLYGGSSVFKALGHPLAAEQAPGLIAELAAAGPLAIYDPLGYFGTFATLYDLSSWDVGKVYVQRLEDLDRTVLGRACRPVTALAEDPAPGGLLVAAFDAERLVSQIRHLIPGGTRVNSFDALRIPETMLSRPRRYLDSLNFATNFAFLRDAGGEHTRITLCDYWSGYGARQPGLWLRLFDAAGRVLGTWQEGFPAPGGVAAIDSRRIRERLGLGDFTGSLFIHGLGVAGHDVIKYALDTFGDEPSVLSCTHDANAWPADLYAGLPAPGEGERVTLWIQNSHPAPIPAGSIGLGRVGAPAVCWVDESIPPFGTYALDAASLVPEARWPAQLEVHAGRHFVRPRYEVHSTANGRSRMAHANVERTDLVADRSLPKVAPLIGRGYLLPAPILPTPIWSSEVLPTPMATGQEELALVLTLFDACGRQMLRRDLGVIPRGECPVLAVDDLLHEAGVSLAAGYGHLELSYDLSHPGGADGWLHALFRYRDRGSGHAAESSFGAHIYNLPVVYRNEPQSYTGSPPGLSTRLFLRLAPESLDTLCQLIYPASAPWLPHSTTRLLLHDGRGAEIAARDVAIPCGGSLLWRYSETFDKASRTRAGDGAYVMVRDPGCRLFGYHGVLGSQGAFSLDHMFGF